MYKQLLYFAVVTTILSTGSMFYGVGYASAADSDLIDDLKTKIGSRTTQISEIEKEIKEYEQQLDGVLQEKSTLETAVRALDITQNKLSADIRVTKNRVSATTLQIEKLALEIAGHGEQISLQSETLADGIRRINAIESNTFLESLLSHENLSDLWEEVETLQQFQLELKHNVENLKELKTDLETSKKDREGRKRELVNYNYELSNQEIVVIINRREKNTLLSQTKNEESNYQKLISEKKVAREQFERELFDLESQLKIAIDPDSIPKPQRGILAWPLGSIFVTQKFGNTAFAQGGAYNGSGHNGIDLRATAGTPVRAVLNGTVIESGNTDEFPGCFSYGKWVLLRHNNGLATLYAHLSLTSVNSGDQILTGQVVGYSGNTGYSTGPHLHFSLYAAEGVQVVRLGDIKKITNCGPARVPVAPFAAYLDPLAYLPAISQ